MSWARAIAFLALASANAQPPNSQNDKPGRVEGAVTDSVTGAPVRKAAVTLFPGGVFRNPSAPANPDSKTATTDAGGRFAFENLPPGSYLVQAQCPGYSALDEAVPPKTIKIAAEQEVKDIAVPLLPLGVIAGRVLDEDGDPVMRASVQALHYQYNQGKRQLVPGSSASTDDLGRFRMIDVSPGSYFLEASPPARPQMSPYGTVNGLTREGYSATYYPSGTDLHSSSKIEMKAGAELDGIEFHFKKAPLYGLRGKVVDGQTGGPASNIMLRFSRDGHWTNHFGRVVADGTFEVSNLPPGTYTILAARPGGPSPAVAHQTVVVGERDLDGVTLELRPAGSVTGSVTMEGAPPDSKAPLRVSLQQTELTMGMGGPSQATVKDDGTFELRGASPGVYTLVLSNVMDGKYLKTVSFNGKEIADSTLDLTNTGGGSLTLLFGADPGAISGAAQPGALVTAAPASDASLRSDQLHISICDPSGNFQLKNLAPGNYKVMAWERAKMNMVQVPEIRKLLESKAASVTLAPNGTGQVQLNPISPAEMEEAVRKLP